MTTCPFGIHVHPLSMPVAMYAGHIIIGVETAVLVHDHDVAERIAELLERHGLTEVPDGAMPPLIVVEPERRIDRLWKWRKR